MEYRNSPAKEVELKIVLLVDLLEMNSGWREEQVLFCEMVKAESGIAPCNYVKSEPANDLGCHLQSLKFVNQILIIL